MKSLYKRNKVPASEGIELLKKAKACDLQFKNPVGNTSLKKAQGTKPEKGLEQRDKNASRTLKRDLQRNKQWGEFYWATIPLWNPKKKQIVPGPVPFLLPHETLSDYMYHPGAKEEAMPEIGTYRSQKWAEACQAASFGATH